MTLTTHRNDTAFKFLHYNEKNRYFAFILFILQRGMLVVTKCNDAGQTSSYSEKDFHEGYLFRKAHHFSHNDLKCVMSAFSIEHHVTKRYGNFLKQ